MNICNEKERFWTIILAAGKGTRMNSDLAKVLHPICGTPMLSYVLEIAKKTGSAETFVIVGHQADDVKKRFRNENLIFIDQHEQLGTGHAVLQARERFADYHGTVIILCGDVPLLKPSTVRSLLHRHKMTGTAVTVLTTILIDPTGYGRIIKEKNGKITRIVEERDATAEEKQIKEINTGIYCADSRFLFRSLSMVNNNNAQKEYYLTDIIAMACAGDRGADTLIAGRPWEVMGINTLEELERAAFHMKMTDGEE